MRRRLPPLVQHILYTTCIRPTIEYALRACSGLALSDSVRIEQAQRSAARLIAGVVISARTIFFLDLALTPWKNAESLNAASLFSSCTWLTLVFLTTCWEHTKTEWLQHRQHVSNGFAIWLSAYATYASSPPKNRTLRRYPFYSFLSLLESVPSTHLESISSLFTFYLVTVFHFSPYMRRRMQVVFIISSSLVVAPG